MLCHISDSINQRCLLLLQVVFSLFLGFPIFSFAAVEYDLLPAPDNSGNWGYMDAKSRQVRIAPKYANAGFFEDGMAIVRYAYREKVRKAKDIEGKVVALIPASYGIIDHTGKEVLPPKYDSVSRASVSYYSRENIPGMFLVSNGAERGVFRSDGQWLLPLGKHGRIEFYKEGYFRFDGGFWINGKIHRPPEGYEISHLMKKADAFLIESKVKKFPSRKKQGVMLPDNRILIQPEYDEIQFVDVPEKRWLVTQVDEGVLDKIVKAIRTNRRLDIDDKKDMLTFYLLDADAKIIKKYRSRYNPFTKNGEISYESGGKQYRINPLNGEIFSDEMVERKAGKHYVLFRKNGFWGVKDRSGKILIEPQYVSMGSLGGNLFVVRKIEGLDTSRQAPRYNVYAENVGVVDASNRVVMPFEYSTIENLGYPGRDTANFMVGKKKTVEGKPSGDTLYGMTDRMGRMVIPLQYTSDFHMNEIGQAQVYDGKHGVIDNAGKVILPLVYRSIFDSRRMHKTKKTFYIAEKDNLWGVYDATGRKIVPHLYQFLSLDEKTISKGWVIGDSPERYRVGAYNYRTGVNIPMIYHSIQIEDQLIVAYYRRADGKRERDVYDLLDFRGKKLATYDRIESLPNGHLIVSKDGKEGVLDVKGKTLLALKYDFLGKAGNDLLWAANRGENTRFLVAETGMEYRIKNE